MTSMAALRSAFVATARDEEADTRRAFRLSELNQERFSLARYCRYRMPMVKHSKLHPTIQRDLRLAEPPAPTEVTPPRLV